MAGISQNHIACPANVDGVLAIYKVAPKTGVIQFNIMAQVNRDLLGLGQKGFPLLVNAYESDDRQTWNQLTTAPGILVNDGAANQFNVITQKMWLKIVGHGVGGAVYAKLDAFFNGSLYYGQLDIDVAGGKTGYGLEGDDLVHGTDPMGGSYDNREGIASYTDTPWPEGPDFGS
jgi:hypothetical protein